MTPESLVLENQQLLEKIALLEVEVAELKLRPPMACAACERHNQQLCDRIDRLVAAACLTCKAAPAFVAAQQWPLATCATCNDARELAVDPPIQSEGLVLTTVPCPDCTSATDRHQVCGICNGTQLCLQVPDGGWVRCPACTKAGPV